MWLDSVKRNMSLIRKSSDEALSFSVELIHSYKSFWNQFSSYALQKPMDPEENGDWFSHTDIEIIVDETVDHLVAKWDQKHPYNTYCPYIDQETGIRAVTGCVAIAAGQLLYFLHDKLGIPSQMVSSGYCVGDIDNYSREFFNYSTAAWSYMSKNYAGAYGNANFEALMLGNIGAIINMHYREKYSWAIPKNIMDDLLPYYGLTCERDDYDEGIVKQSLEENMPVVVSASDCLIPVDGDIHCFVIDGYRKTHEEYTTYHYWVPDDGEPDFDPDHQSYYTTSRSDTEINSIKINWGWSSQWTSGINDGWYTLTDDWLTTLNNDTQTWNHHRVIYHSFSLSTD